MKVGLGLSILLLAALARGDVIGVTGSGTAIFPNPDSWSIAFSGSDGTDYVSASCGADGPFFGDCPLGGWSNWGARPMPSHIWLMHSLFPTTAIRTLRAHKTAAAWASCTRSCTGLRKASAT